MINDKMTKKFGMEIPKFPKLKGHIKLTLKDARTGCIDKVVEGENIITNAVQDIFDNNFLGMVDYSKLWGSDGLWKTWFGGVLCYEDAHPTVEGELDPADYFPQADSDNHLTAHAGQTAIDPNHDDDSARGNPVSSSYVETENSMKQVWEWGTTHGNGVISALSLTHSDTGNAGLGNTGYYFQNSFNPYADIKSSTLSSIYTSIDSSNNIVAMYDENHGLYYHIGGDTYATSGWDTRVFQTTTLTIIIKRLPFLKAGLFETLTPRASEQRVITVTDIPFNLYTQPAFYFDYTNKYLWIFSNMTGIGGSDGKWGTWSDTIMNYAIIDCNPYDNEPQTRIVDSDTITVANTAGYKLAPTSFANGRPVYDQWRGDDFHGIVVEDGYVYLPTTAGMTPHSWAGNINWYHNGFRKVRLSTGVEVDLIKFNSSKVRCRTPIIGGGIIIEDDRVCNGTTGYTCLALFTDDEYAYNTWNAQTSNKLSFTMFPLATGDYGTYARYIFANKMVNTTKYNLPTAVQKTASQAMSIEYTLTEVEPEEEEE